MNACLDFVEPFLWNVDKKCMTLFCFEGNLIRALLNSLNGRSCTKTAVAFICIRPPQGLAKILFWHGPVVKMFLFSGRIWNYVLNIFRISGRGHAGPLKSFPDSLPSALTLKMWHTEATYWPVYHRSQSFYCLGLILLFFHFSILLGLRRNYIHH